MPRMALTVEKQGRSDLLLDRPGRQMGKDSPPPPAEALRQGGVGGTGWASKDFATAGKFNLCCVAA